MRRLIFICALCLVATLALAQRITRRDDNVSLSKVLMELNDLQQEYTVNFIYDELEDFRVTTDIKHEKLTDAIQQMIGFYPVRMTVKSEDNEIFVECTHKTDRHLTGCSVSLRPFYSRSYPDSTKRLLSPLLYAGHQSNVRICKSGKLRYYRVLHHLL